VSDETYGGHFPMLSDFKRNFKTGKMKEEHSIMKRVALHAYGLTFECGGKQYDVHAPYPKDFAVFLKLLEKFDN
jgi:23S rRNA pseudouridine955/2504/2580 synthase